MGSREELNIRDNGINEIYLKFEIISIILLDTIQNRSWHNKYLVIQD